jgi:uncharacterized protein (TIGR03435 family)
MTRPIVWLVLISMTTAAAWGQALPSIQKFEVASIRLHTGPVHRVGGMPSGPRLVMEAMSLRNLVGYAYDVKDYQIAGTKDWMETDRYDISAKAEGDGQRSRVEFREMMQSLLAERFHVVLHHESREMPVYALTVSKGGPKLKDSPPDAKQMLLMESVNRSIRLTVTKGSMDQLVTQFSNSNGVDRPAVDHTGLTGLYDYKLEWGLSSDPDTVSIYTAIQEQLGLKFEPTRAPIDSLLVDHAERPGEN